MPIPKQLRYLSLIAVFLISAFQARATTYTYVGSFAVDAGPSWETSPLAYSGIGAAALLYGGSSSDYVISTVDDNPANINFMANYDGYAVSEGVFADDFFVGTEGTTVYDQQGVMSAYVDDHDDTAINYVFRVDSVAATPEPGTLALLSTGLLGVAATLRRRIFNR
jgi:PEP-CTERM motif